MADFADSTPLQIHFSVMYNRKAMQNNWLLKAALILPFFAVNAWATDSYKVTFLVDQVSKVHRHEIILAENNVKILRNTRILCGSNFAEKYEDTKSANPESKRHMVRFKSIQQRLAGFRRSKIKTYPHRPRYFFNGIEVTQDPIVAPMIRHALEDSCALE